MAKIMVQINYKSGQSVVVEVEEFSLQKTGSKLDSVNWKEIKPRPLLFGVDSVESIWQISGV